MLDIANTCKVDDDICYKPALPKSVTYKVGASYKMNGVVYHPHVVDNYEKTGTASWYGPGFDGKKTANGAIFHKEELTAAHPTLPLFSRVWVTNLTNGKRILVTVNDRGPYHGGRLIDLSHGAAKLLDYESKGTTKVKVEYDKAETERYLKEIGLFNQYLMANAK